MVDLLGITCDGDGDGGDGGGGGGGVNVIALIRESCWRGRHKSSASVSYSSSLSKSVLNDIYCTSRLNGGEFGIGFVTSIKEKLNRLKGGGCAGGGAGT